MAKARASLASVGMLKFEESTASMVEFAVANRREDTACRDLAEPEFKRAES